MQRNPAATYSNLNNAIYSRSCVFELKTTSFLQKLCRNTLSRRRCSDCSELKYRLNRENSTLRPASCSINVGKLGWLRDGFDNLHGLRQYWQNMYRVGCRCYHVLKRSGIHHPVDETNQIRYQIYNWNTYNSIKDGNEQCVRNHRCDRVVSQCIKYYFCGAHS
jgi:hypothetical protein